MIKPYAITLGGQYGNELLEADEINGGLRPLNIAKYNISVTPKRGRTTEDDKAASQQQFDRNKLAETRDKFIWAKFNEDGGQRFCSNLDFATLARLIYLSTYVSYTSDGEDGYLTNGLVSRSQQPMTRSEMKTVLGLPQRTFDRFILKVSPVDENGEIRNGADAGTVYLTQGKNDTWYLNSLYLSRGKLTGGESIQTNRIFIEQVRRLYKIAKPSQHKQLGMIFALMPWISKETNVICLNPDEPNADAVIPLNAQQICKALSLNPHHAEDTVGCLRNGRIYGNLYKELLNIELEIDGIKQVFCLAEVTKYGIRLVVNPNFIYGGTDRKKLTERNNLFVNPLDLARITATKNSQYLPA